MQNWSIDEKKFEKHSEDYAIWQLEQMINFGLGKDKISETMLRKHWQHIHIDPARKKFLTLLLDGDNNPH